MDLTCVRFVINFLNGLLTIIMLCRCSDTIKVCWSLISSQFSTQADKGIPNWLERLKKRSDNHFQTRNVPKEHGCPHLKNLNANCLHWMQTEKDRRTDSGNTMCLFHYSSNGWGKKKERFHCKKFYSLTYGALNDWTLTTLLHLSEY